MPFLSRLGLLGLIISVGACCTSSAISSYGHRQPERESLLKLAKFKASPKGFIRIFELPESCWPKRNKKKLKGALPNRSTRPIYSGLDAMVIDHFSLLKGRRFALLTNATGRDYKLEKGLELMFANGVVPELLLEPEHGLYGHADELLPNGLRQESYYKIPILSLYSRNKRPSEKFLRGLDLIVVDIKNLPVRCYTYITTLTYILEAAERLGIEVMVLDRSHPYGFLEPVGSFLEQKFESFVGTAPVPFLYSLTPGEYARYLRNLRLNRLRLTVVKVSNFRYREADAAIRGAWINPSPNIPSYESALVYAGMVFFEGVNYSLGRGTTRPFIYSGAPWLDSALLLSRLQIQGLKGVELSEVSFRPAASVYKGQLCKGIQITPTSVYFDPIRTGYEYMRLVRHLYPRRFRYRRHRNGAYFIDLLWGSDSYRKAIEANLKYEEFQQSWVRDVKNYKRIIKKYRMYD